MAGGEYRAEKWSAGPTSFPAGGHPPWKIPGYAPGKVLTQFLWHEYVKHEVTVVMRKDVFKKSV
jgi:hypothetical protein